MKKILTSLIHYQAFLVVLIILGVFGFTAYKVSLVINSAPDPEMIEAQKKAAPTAIVKIDIPTINSLSNLTVVNGETGITATNKPDPFTP